MGRADIEQASLVEAVVTRLQTALALTERQCYPVARSQDVPILPPGGDYWLTVAPGDGQFVPEEQVAGNVTEESEIVVSGYTRIKTDSSGHDRFLLMDDRRGLLRVKKIVLGALCGQDLLNSDGDSFLRQLLFARTATAPDIVNAGPDGVACGKISVTFGCTFDWDLTT